MTAIPDPATHRDWLTERVEDLLRFGLAAPLDEGGFGVLDEQGRVTAEETTDLLITARMTHVFSIGMLLGHDGAERLVDHGVAALRYLFADPLHGGWFQRVNRADGSPASSTKDAYSTAFVLLAATSAYQAGHRDAPALLRGVVDVIESRFWDEETGWMKESWDNEFRELEPYRGANSNMHTVEAFLAAADATGDTVWLDRALRISERLVHRGARGNGWRIIEHFDAEGRPDLEYNHDDVAHQFRPYGATIGHALEWSRLLLHLDAALGESAPGWLVESALALYDTAVREGWAVDGADGFVYTTDWTGKPVVRARLHWVIAEAIGATAARWRVTRADDDAARYYALWEHVAEFFLDHEHGSWFHELDTQNRPSSEVWAGKPDLYHALQTALIPRLPLAPSLAAALQEGRLDTAPLPLPTTGG